MVLPDELNSCEVKENWKAKMIADYESMRNQTLNCYF